MKYYLVFSLLLLNCFSMVAQTGKPIRVRAGEDIAKAYSSNGFYRFPQFGKATLYYRTGAQSSTVLFNYNLLSGNMQFISKSDTLDLGGLTGLDSIVFDNASFVYNNGFFEVVGKVDSLKLLKRVQIKTQLENIGAYGIPNSTASIVNMRNFTSSTGVYSLVINQDILLIENIGWFFVTGNDGMIKASKSNLFKSLSKEKQKTAEMYLGQNKTNFEREGDLRKLMDALAK
jgi:hypothetical protein